MSDTNGVASPKLDVASVRDEWVAAVNELVARVEGWCKELDWATRRAPKRIEDDRQLGVYDVPMLLIQQWDVRLLLEPTSRFGLKNDGQCDLYVMPAYDDMAVVYRRGKDWFVQERIREGLGEERLLTLDTLREMVGKLRAIHAEAR